MQDYRYKLSIISPIRIYNNNQMFRYAQQMLDSIQNAPNVEKYLNQFEVIIVDDASETEELKDLKRKDGLNLKCTRNKENLNIGGSRNTGLDISEGEYIWYIDGDDAVVPENFTKLIDRLNELKDEDDVQLVFVAFETIMNYNKENKTAQKKINKLELQDYACCPVSASCKIVRKDKCVRFPERVYLEDVVHNFRQLDVIDGKDNTRIFNDVLYWRYLNIRISNYSHSNRFLQINQPSFFQLITQNIMCKGYLKDHAISDLFRVLGNMYDLRHELKHENVKQACIQRTIRIFNNIQTQKWSH